MIRRLAMQCGLAAIVAIAAAGGPAARAQSVPEDQLDTFLGLTPPSGLSTGALTNIGNGPVTNGSAIMQMVTVPSGGATLTFSADFLTNAPAVGLSPLGAVDPFAFYTQPTPTDFADAFTNDSGPPALTGLIPAPSQSGYAYQTGYTTYSVSLSAGTYALGFGVANVTSNDYTSALLITNLILSAGTLANGSFGTGNFTGWSTIGATSVTTSALGISPPGGATYQALLSTVPEPSAIVLLVTGGLGVSAFARRRRAG